MAQKPCHETGSDIPNTSNGLEENLDIVNVRESDMLDFIRIIELT